MLKKDLVFMGNNRRKGHNYERELRKEFVELGFTECVTSRFGSKMMDDRGIDLINTGIIKVQAKSTINLNSRKVLDKMQVEKTDIPVVFHKLPRGNQYCTLYKEDFMELLEMLIANKIIKTDG
jgi:Holliday junction resolvase